MNIRRIVFSLIFLPIGIHAQQVVHLEKQSPGRIFEGIGALSAGASSRLLVDYPEPVRSELLDLLFKPYYGASLHHLKVEIGGDVNSTDGTEPSFAHNRDEFLHPLPEYYERGYEFWLMKEAKKRNREIQLDCLPWGAPGWIGNGNFFSRDNIDYVIRFLEVARDIHHLDIDYVGIWNERPFSNEYPENTQYIKLLKQELIRHQLPVKIVAYDEPGSFHILPELLKDPELLDAVDVLGSHYQYWYPHNIDLEGLVQTGKPIWSSEDGPWRGDWPGAMVLAKRFNRNYIDFRMSKTIIWSLITSYADILPIPGSGPMRANTPWSGYYEVQPALWAIAHFTQFIQPGWRYLEEGCGYTADSTSSYTSLLSPGETDLSVIIETSGSSTNQSFLFVLPPSMAKKEFFLWKSDSLQQFILVKKLKPKNGHVSILCDKRSIYSLSTTRGQEKGSRELSIPADHPFPLPYQDDFASYTTGQLPHFTQDQSGIFEVRTKDKQQALKQVITGVGIEWHFHLNPEPCTILGDTNMRDYTMSINVMLSEPNQTASLFGRINKVSQVTVQPPYSYYFQMRGNGNWILGISAEHLLQTWVDLDKKWPLLKLSFPDHTRNCRLFTYEEIQQLEPSLKQSIPGLTELMEKDNDPESLRMMVFFDGTLAVYRDRILASGHTSFLLGQWNRMAMCMEGYRITVMIDDNTLVTVTDPTYTRGLAGFGCGWHEAWFDNLSITPIPKK
jgi:hypothetical protein